MVWYTSTLFSGIHFNSLTTTTGWFIEKKITNVILFLLSLKLLSQLKMIYENKVTQSTS